MEDVGRTGALLGDWLAAASMLAGGLAGAELVGGLAAWPARVDWLFR